MKTTDGKATDLTSPPAGAQALLRSTASARRLAVVTGASVGIGAALAAEYAAHDYDLLLVARREAPLEALAKLLAARHGVRAETLALDLGARDSVDALVAAIAARGGVDALVNNAGVGQHGAFLAGDGDRTVAMIELNVIALTRLTRALLPGMVARRSGHVLNVASTAAFQAGPFGAVYGATKGYVLLFSEALHEELRGTGVTVTALCPGPTETEFAGVAGASDSPLFEGKSVMSAVSVARAGYAGAASGRAICIAGVRNALLAWSVRFMPRVLVRRITRRMMEPRGTVRRSAVPAPAR